MLNILKPISTSPSFNLAWEEYILKHIYSGEELFFLWQNSPSIVVGRNQNVYEEVNLIYLNEQKIPLFRRNSGGGTVYHDLGNLNYTFITKASGKVNNYELMTEPIIKALNSLGINAYFNPKSDIKLMEHKIGGNAQFLYKDLLLHHGTILFNSNLNELTNCLLTNKSHTSKAIKSRPSTVININEFTDLTIAELIDYIYDYVAPNANEILLTNNDIENIRVIETEKYLSSSWNYFESPSSNYYLNKDNYIIDLEIEKGLIKRSLISYNNIELPLISSLLLNKKFLPNELLFLKKDYLEIYNLLFKKG